MSRRFDQTLWWDLCEPNVQLICAGDPSDVAHTRDRDWYKLDLNRLSLADAKAHALSASAPWFHLLHVPKTGRNTVQVQASSNARLVWRSQSSDAGRARSVYTHERGGKKLACSERVSYPGEPGQATVLSSRSPPFGPTAPQSNESATTAPCASSERDLWLGFEIDAVRLCFRLQLPHRPARNCRMRRLRATPAGRRAIGGSATLQRLGRSRRQPLAPTGSRRSPIAAVAYAPKRVTLSDAITL